MSAIEGQVIANKTVVTIQIIRNEECFQLFWENVSKMAERKDISGPVLPRKRKRPRRYEESEAPHEYDETPFSMYKRIYYEALDLLISSITSRFDQPGYRAHCCLQNLILKVVNKDDCTASMEEVLDKYKDDLKIQLQILASTIPAGINNIVENLTYLQCRDSVNFLARFFS